MKKTKTQYQYKLTERNGQLVIALNSEIMIPENAPVRLTSAQLEEMNYEELYRAYSPKGRKTAADPRVLFEVLVYGYQCGIYSSRKLEEACRYRVDFMWLLGDERTPDHTTLARFRTGRCRDCIEALFYEFVRKLEEQGETDHGAVFIDGTKLESRAGRYTFVWRKNVEKQLGQVKAGVQAESGHTTREGLERHLRESAQGITFVKGPGHRKSEEQKRREKLSELHRRNSYSKTDPDATFMRLKEDHMRNGQLKPAYNVQLAVNSEYITGIELFSDRNDVKTLRPFLRRLEQFHQARYEEVTADAGEGCPCRTQCCRAKDQDKPKELVLQKTFWVKRAQAEENITTPRGIHLRLCRSIQVEGAFGLLKNDFAFRRFLTRGRANVRTELFLLTLAFDLKKLWMKREHGRLKTRCSEKMTA